MEGEIDHSLLPTILFACWISCPIVVIIIIIEIGIQAIVLDAKNGVKGNAQSTEGEFGRIGRPDGGHPMTIVGIGRRRRRLAPGIADELDDG